MVSSTYDGVSYALNLRLPYDTPVGKPKITVAICTYGRPESLDVTLKSLEHQTYDSFEVVLITEKGNLSELRDKGLRTSAGDITILLDDDVYCQPTWLQAVADAFKEEGVVGVTGPTIITEEYKKNRDCFKFKKLSDLQGWLFKVPSEPGRLSPYGTPSMASNYAGCTYEGEVDYLECCNMAVKRKEAIEVGGFDYDYIKTSEWCELDLSLRLRKKGRLVFRQACAIEHRPSKAGIYTNRLKTNHRWLNFMRFQKKWVKPGLLTYTYRAFIWTYLKIKDLRMI